MDLQDFLAIITVVGLSMAVGWTIRGTRNLFSWVKNNNEDAKITFGFILAIGMLVAAVIIALVSLISWLGFWGGVIIFIAIPIVVFGINGIIEDIKSKE